MRDTRGWYVTRLGREVEEHMSELKPCKYRKEHEWAEDGLCNHCFVAKPKEPEPKAEEPAPIDVAAALGVTWAQQPSSNQWYVFTGNSGTAVPNPQQQAAGVNSAQQAGNSAQQQALDSYIQSQVSGNKLMPMQKMSVLQALVAGGFQLAPELKRQLDHLQADMQREAETAKEYTRQQEWAAMRRAAMERCAHVLDKDEEHPDDYAWCRECRNWIDPND
jgi:hypothetical protein